MKSIFYINYTTKTAYKDIMQQMVSHAINSGAMDKYLEGKKIVVMMGNNPKEKIIQERYSYSRNTSLFGKDPEPEFIILNKSEEFSWLENLNSENYMFKKRQGHKVLSNKIFVWDKETLFDTLVEMSSTDVGKCVQIDFDIAFLKAIWAFSKIPNKTYTHNSFELLMSEDQLQKYKSCEDESLKGKINSYLLGFIGGMAASDNGYQSLVIESNFILDLFTHSNANCSYANFSLGMTEQVVEAVNNYNSLMFKLCLDHFGINDTLKKVPYFINWDYNQEERVGSIYKLFKQVLDERDLSHKEQEKIMKKSFAVHPTFTRDVNGVDNYFLTFKDFDKKAFYKKIVDFFKTRATVESKQKNLELFEILMEDEEIQEQRELFESFFPVFYQEEISFKNFIEIKPKELKYAEFKIKELMEFFPLNNSHEEVMNQYISFIREILKNYETDIFINTKKETIIEKKKEREVVSLMQLYFSGDNLDFLSNEFIQKMLRMIHDTIQEKFAGQETLKPMSREIYLKLNLNENKDEGKRKNKI